MKKVVILGITGSIGTTALKGIQASQDKLKLVGYSYHLNDPKIAGAKAFCLNENYRELTTFINSVDADIVLNGISGSAGLYASIAVINSKTTLALANKETVVMGMNLIFDYAKKMGVKIIPVDSEHSAIDELIQTNGKENIASLIITASGGPFKNRSLAELENITVKEAIKHPTWNMGPKISIDSSTLANKGLEVIEAHYLFGFEAEKIEVTIHPQSIVHSMVRTTSGQVYAQMSPPDMTFPIMRALLERDFNKSVGTALDFTNLNLNFYKPDYERFPFLTDAFECVKKEGSYPIVFNTANEIAVDAFVKGRIKFTQIETVVREALNKDWTASPSSLDDILEIQNKIKKVVLV